MSRTFEVVTPEHVAIRYELAGYGSRALAALLDWLAQFLLVLVLFVLLSLALRGATTEIKSWDEFAHSALFGAFILAVFLIFWGYYIFFETRWNGETPGKRIMGLRVISDGGYPVDFRAVVIRNLLRAVDILPGFPPLLPIYGCAMVSVLCHSQYKRLGDLAAGTIVVRHGHDEQERTRALFGEAVVYRVLDAAVLSRLALITREEHHLIQQFLEKRHALQQPLRGEFACRLAAPLMEKLAYQLPPLGVDYERWLDELDLACRTRAFGTAPPPISSAPAPTPAPTPPERPQPPVVTRKW